MWWTKSDIREGMFVTSVAGQRLGKVIRCDADTFIIEKGVFFPKDFELRYDHITDVTDSNVTYLLSDEYALQTPASKATGAATAAAAGAAGLAGSAGERVKAAVRGAKEELTEKRDARSEAKAEAKVERLERREAKAAMSAENEIHIPLMKEEMDVEKIQRESGHVKIHKAVKTEERRVSVPLRREEVIIEHVSAASREGSAFATDGAFSEQTVDIPLHEEELRVGKHAVVREEVIVRTIAQSFDREAAASLRSEDLEIEDTRPLPKLPTSPTGYGAPGSMR
jgi:uncharacterized protein (TIGR02271 family)